MMYFIQVHTAILISSPFWINQPQRTQSTQRKKGIRLSLAKEWDDRLDLVSIYM